MNNLYIFAIGGSGERVMRSLIMLLAAGVKIGANNVVPIFVDNDAKSMALTRCLKLISYYNAVSENAGKNGIGTLVQKLEPEKRPSFFSTKIADPILLDIAGDQIGNLKSIIGLGLRTEDPVEKDILEERDLLFSEDDLNMKLTVGFVGNPNIGSVVLNTLSFNDTRFNDILNAGQGDGVMVVGSLFGGTGAAGFPLIVNTFMRSDKSRPTIGGVAVLPYFEFGEKDEYDENIIDTSKWDVKSDTFSAKTRAALMYYDDYMKNMDYLYYVGDNYRSLFPHFVGGPKQDNPAHLVELLSAISIIDFSKRGNQTDIEYRRPIFGIDNDNAGHSTICNIASIKTNEVKKALIKFQLLRELFINKGDGFLWHLWGNDSPITRDIAFTDKMLEACRGNNPEKVYKDVNELDNVLAAETREFQYAWGLNAFFKEWIVWFEDLGGKDARRKFSIFPNNGDSIDQNNVTLKFFNSNDYGIAKTKQKKEGLMRRREITVPIYPDLATNILNAHKHLRWAGVPEEKKLAALLKTISDGLDKVLEDNCAI
ncbi:MAG: hypothetical protein K2N28_07355 [Muribaculaceae bacterium]|nr:hypothetical protein [Muribaculaceae bacterium]